MDREYQGGRGNNDLSEAPRLAASFFSSQISNSNSTVYRDVRHTRTVSPQPTADRYPSQSNRHYRERDSVDEQWWPSNRSASQERYLSTRSVSTADAWEEADAYAGSGSRSRTRTREENYGWDEADHERKEVDYPTHAEAEAMRVTKRVDWTGLFRDGREGGSSEASMGKQSNPSYGGQYGESYMGKRSNPGYGSRQYGESYQHRESYVSGQDDLIEREEPVLSNRGRNPHEGLPKGRGYIDRVPERGYLDEVPERLEDYGSMGAGQDVSQYLAVTEWAREGGRHEERDFRHGGIRSAGMSKVSEVRRGFASDDPSPYLNRGNTPMGRREVMNPKPDYSVRASLTNRDILGYYYGNSAHQPRKEFQRRGGAPLGRNHGFPGPWHGHPSRGLGGHGTEKEDWGLARKGKKRWMKSPRAREGPPGSWNARNKRFKRETEADKLFLMHNSKATSVETKETPGLRPSEKGKEREECVTPIREDTEKNPGPDVNSVEKGLWDNDDIWSGSEEEKERTGYETFEEDKNCDLSEKEDTEPIETRSDDELEKSSAHSSQGGIPDDLNKPCEESE